ncbi:MAG: SH3 domain-containing protein [Rhodobacter sp.]|nr:SH3 domain-containing protein [Paracoccaceae bacterium]MCC0077508.1 SH3 domain-containing protein [Rhodobacter sp.]
MSLTRYLPSVLTSTTALLLSSVAAWGVEATSNTWLNVRSGPSSGHAVVDTLYPGEHVEVEECETNGWCRITRPGPDGWVNSDFISPVPGGGGSADPDCRFQLTIDASGPHLSIICGGGGGGGMPPPAPPPSPPPAVQACFYANTGFGGTQTCRGVGVWNSLPGPLDNSFSSVRLTGGARAQLCDLQNLGGYCRVIDADTPVLGPLINDRTSSLRVFTGVLPPIPVPPAPVTLSTGPIALSPTQQANLDNGAVGPAGADIRYVVLGPLRQLQPVNGAQLARGDGSNRGFAGCSTEAFSSANVPFAALPPGTYVCARTNQGHISQFRVNGFSGLTMNLGYTTWAN